MKICQSHTKKKSRRVKIRNFLQDLSEIIKNELNAENRPVINEVVEGKDLSGSDPKIFENVDYNDCVVFMECDLFYNETVAIICGKARVRKHHDNPGGRITMIETGKKIEFDGVIFSDKELKILFESKSDNELILSIYNVKKRFGSMSRIIRTEKDLEEIWDDRK